MLVVKHLKAKGYRHVESNYLKRHGEIDLVMEHGGIIHFIEVKTVSREILIGQIPNYHVIHETNRHKPEENVSRWKLRKISRTVQSYLLERDLGNREWQFDVAVVYLDRVNKKAGIKFIKDIQLLE